MYPSHHSDPYAGQYPPPPPPTLPEDIHNQPLQSSAPPQPAYHVIVPSLPQEQQHYPEINQPTPHVAFAPETYTTPPSHIPPLQEPIYSPPLQARPEYMYPQTNNSHIPHDEEANLHGVNEYNNNSNQASLEDYLRQEREEYMKHQTHPHLYNEPNKQTEEYQELLTEPDNRLTKKEAKKLKKQQEKEEEKRAQYEPYLARPTLAPENEAEAYRYRPYEQSKSRGCNCCCYNPAMTCCSCFWFLISVAFIVGGIALIIASKVVSDRCNSQCGQLIEQAQEACGSICSKVVHDAMLYGGIVVAGLAGIAAIWRIVMWTCAGFSK
ncbi:hypothetical protein RMATCC62417_02709 [Rhizopus microsporus]|nr:hypothetical protein RMATCC62417_02709 [Rhizopus microsporus]